MNRLLFYILICILTTCACSHSSNPARGNEKPKSSDSIQTDSDVFKNNQPLSQEKWLGQLEVKMSAITDSVTKINNEINDVKTKIENLEKEQETEAHNLLELILIIVIVLLIILFVLYTKIQNQIKKERKQAENHTSSSTENQRYIQIEPSTYKSYSKYNSLENRINALENEIKKNAQSTNSKIDQQIPQPPQQNKKTQPQKQERVIWFGANSENLFTNEYPAGDEHIAFKAIYTSEDEVEFEPTDWERIKSLNQLSCVVKKQVKGNGSKMKIGKRGKAKKQICNNGRVLWQVTSQAEITIS